METWILLEWEYEGYEPPVVGDCADFGIPGLPFNDVNSNVGMTDDFDVTYSDGADVAYELTLGSATTITVDLCSALTDYDTKLEIFTADGECVPTTTGYYNDDGPFGTCPESPAPYTPSLIENAYLDAGTYYIVVDGFGGAEGNYEINIWVSAALASLPVDPAEALAYEVQKSGLDASEIQWNYPVENVSRECGIIGFNVYMEGTSGDWAYIGTTDQLFFEYAEGAEGCFHVTATDMYPDNYNESAPSNDACVNACNGMVGDWNEDGAINVLDIVQIVGYILNGGEISECQAFYGDWNGDGAINVLDIVQIVGYILNPSSRDMGEASSVNFIKANGEMKFHADGVVGGVQMTLSHGADFSIHLTSDAYLAEYVTDGNSTRLIIINPESEVLFTTSGAYEVTEVLAATLEGMIDTNMSAPTTFSLSAAYPNPFNPTTSFTLEIPQDGYISMKVYNVIGQVVDVLVDQNMAAGYHTVSWTVTNVPSGMYFVRSAMGKEVQTQKVLLLK